MLLEKVLVQDYASEGKSLAKIDGKVYFIQNAVPGDVVDLKILRKKKKFVETQATHFHSYSEQRSTPFCSHFGVCGGCSWQNLKYEHQLSYKHKEIESAFAKIKLEEKYVVDPIIGSKKDREYRNKLEFTFSESRWIVNPLDESEKQGPALGFHVPGRFDKVLEIQACHLQDVRSNNIRNFVRDFCLASEYSFFDLRAQVGLMRNIIIRNTSLDQWMVVVVFAELDQDKINHLLDKVSESFPFITSLYYIVNQKRNDTIYDQELILFKGEKDIQEDIEGIRYRISPKSFFQVNHDQTLRLYQKIMEYSDIKSTDIIYDLYCGTGSISLQLAKKAQKVIGIELIEDAIKDAYINASDNGISNVHFVAGDMADVLSSNFFDVHGRPNTIVVDPPRSGMHPKVVQAIIDSGAERLVYVSCNVHTQTRDVDMLRNSYTLERVQPVDMFPQTKHCENIIVLRRTF